MLEGLITRCRVPEKRAEYEKELVCPALPGALAYLWMIYRRIRRRKGNSFGVQPIEWPDIDSFLRHAKYILAPWEIEIIEDIDDLYLIANSPAKKPTESEV